MLKKSLTALLMGTFLITLHCDDPKTTSGTSSLVALNALIQHNAPALAVSSNEEMTYEEFKAQTFQEPDSGVFIADGDMAFENEEQLKAFYEQNFRKGRLIVNTVNNIDDKWDNTQKLNITYCVSPLFFLNYGKVKEMMKKAGDAWEKVANVNFEHKGWHDLNCAPWNNSVVFDVRPVIFQRYLARAFFPSSSRSNRNVLIDSSAFSNSGSATLEGILRHELGHTLGFRHEHTRPEAGTCFENNEWRELTSYDPYSVMHYPQCNGKGDWSLTLTEMDANGAAILYGAPVAK